MTTNIKNTGYVVNINNANADIAYLSTAWAPEAGTVNRQLIPVGDNTYYFPTFGKGFNGTINGQIITIYNKSGNTLTITTGTAQVYYNNTYYGGSNSRFAISNNRVVMFVLLHGQYYVQLYLGNT